MPDHVSVMTPEIVSLLGPGRGRCFVDATLGLGGHSAALLEAGGPDVRVVGLDRDGEMLVRARERLAGFGEAFQSVRARFSFMADAVRGVCERTIDGVVLDLGLCSAQLDLDERGFTFREDAAAAPLDMRMDRHHGESAADLLARVGEDELREILAAGDVPAPARAAQAICAARPIATVGALAEVVASLRGPRRRHHPATLVFQALRMAVNDEPGELDRALEAALELLRPGGRLVVLSYHSGEDRRVKAFLRREERGCICPPDLPACGCGRAPRIRVLRRGDAPSGPEVAGNPRARSARLRAGERL